MNHPSHAMIASSMLKRPSAYLPLLMSSAALTLIMVHLAVHGPAPQADEGAAAHLWQLLMACQVPVIVVFAARWLPEAPQAATRILLLQLSAMAAAAAPIFILGW